jgi:hypothetical protein
VSAQQPDTGSIALGHKDYSRYDTPGACLDAILTTRDEIWRTAERDTLPYDPDRDTLPTASVAAGRKCGAHFTVQNTELRELRNLMDLFLAIGEDTLARSVAQRRFKSANTDVDRGEVLYETLGAYLDAHPMRRAAAESTLVHLDAGGRSVLGLRIAAHEAMQNEALQRFDRARIRSEAQTILAYSRRMTAAERDDWMPSIRSAYTAAIALFWYEQPANIPKLYRQALADVGPLRHGTAGTEFFGYQYFNVTQQILRIVEMLGKPTPQLQAQYWFNAGQDTIRPHIGKVSLFVRVNKNCGRGCYPLYSMIRRLARKYTNAGLEITLMTKTSGFSPGSAPQEPDVESKEAQHYFLDFLDLPVALAVANTPFHLARNGQRVDDSVQYEKEYQDASLVLSGRDGKAVMISGVVGESVINAFIKRALGLRE